MVLALIAALAVAGPADGIRRAECSLVPPETLQLGGYTERGSKTFVPGGDDLKCRVLYFSSMESAVVSLEMLTIPESLYEAVRKRTPGMLFMSATHTHCAPDSQMLNSRMTLNIPGIANFKQRWLDWYSDKIVGCIEAARKAPAEEIKSWSMASFNVGMNRGRRKGAVPSPLMRVLYLNGKPLLSNYSAHPVNYGPETLTLQSDWPGRLMERTGMISFPGALGDVSPNFGDGTPAEKVDRFVTKVQGLIADPKPSQIVSLRSERGMGSTRFAAPLPVPHPNFAKTNRVPEVLAKMTVAKFAPPTMQLTYLTIGKRFAIIGVSGEPTSELGRSIETEMRKQGYPHVWVVAHVNGWAGYMLEPDDYDRGGYEAELSFYGRDERKAILNGLLGVDRP